MNSVKQAWMKSAVKRPGALHRALGVPQGEKIPVKKIAAKKSALRKVAHKSPAQARLSKEITLAETFRKFRK